MRAGQGAESHSAVHWGGGHVLRAQSCRGRRLGPSRPKLLATRHWLCGRLSCDTLAVRLEAAVGSKIISKATPSKSIKG